MRLFVAVYPPPGAVADLGRVVDQLAVTEARARVSAREQWHVTLTFLGEVAPTRYDRAVAALHASAVGGSFELRVAGGGTFGRGASTILWAGVDGERDRLVALVRGLRRALRRAQVRFDDRPFRPHLTLARPGARLDAARVAADRAVLAGYVGPLWPVTTLHLVSSELVQAPQGPFHRYTTVASADLA